jgi:energy-converting hydrogenase B subunit D
MIGVQIAALALVGTFALAVVLVHDVLRMAMLYGMYGLLLIVLFVVFQAPDVALSELVVGMVAFPVIVVTALAKVARRDRREK